MYYKNCDNWTNFIGEIHIPFRPSNHIVPHFYIIGSGCQLFSQDFIAFEIKILYDTSILNDVECHKTVIL